jgi:23S rRNA (uracil1939-C5)-methyltransferase
VRRTKDEGRSDPTSASGLRTSALCRHFGACGGCSQQDVPYAQQLRAKTDTVTRLVRAVLPDAPAARPMLCASADNPWGQRQKAHFVFERGVMGHYARGSRRLLEVVECPVHDPRANELAFKFQRAFRRLDDPSLKGVVVRSAVGTNEIGATLVFDREPGKRMRSATKTVLEREHGLTSMHINIQPRDDGFIFGRETRKIAGSERVREQVAGASFLISPASFFQTNVAAAEILVRLVLDAVGNPESQSPHPRGDRVLDLYAGAGLFAIPLAKAGHTVVAVEENRSAVADGEANLRLNRVAPERCRFIAAPVEKALGQSPIKDHQSPIGIAVLDPPREGCSAEVIDGVFGGIRPAKAIYISCEPDALARDLGRIAPLGYRVDSLQPVDMFPHTAHIETVAVLSRTASGGARDRSRPRRSESASRETAVAHSGDGGAVTQPRPSRIRS